MTDDQEPVFRVGGVPEHFNLPWRLAIEDRAFDKLGVEVRFRDYPGGTGAMTAALRAGELDLALLLTEGGIYDILNGGDNRLVKVFVESPLIWGIHVATASDIATVGQIENRRIAISRYGSGSHLIAIVDAADRGFDLAAMRFVVVDNLEGARTALADGRADVFLWEKHMTQPIVDAGEFRRIGERVAPWPAFVVSVRRDVLSGSAATIRSILDTVAARALQLLESDSAAEIIRDRYGIDVADAERWLATVRYGQDYTVPDDAFRRVCRALHVQGAIPAAEPDIDQLWHAL